MISLSLQAQEAQSDITVLNGPIFSFRKASEPKKIIQWNNDSYIVHYVKSGDHQDGTIDHYLRKFDAELAFVQEQKLNQKIKGSRTYAHHLFTIKDKIYQFATTSNELDFKSVIYLQEIETSDLTISEARKIITIPSKTFSPSNDISVCTSEGDSHVALIYKVPTTKFNSQQFAMFIFDEQMNFIWNKNFELPASKHELELADFTLDTNGEVHLLAKRVLVQSGSLAKDDERGMRHDFVYFNFLKDGSLEVINIREKSKFLHDLKVTNSDGNFLAAGIYTNIENLSTGGVFTLTIKEDLKPEFVFSEIDRSFFTSSLSEKELEKLDKKITPGLRPKIGGIRKYLPEYTTLDIAANSDGTVRFVAEQRLQFVTSSNSLGAMYGAAGALAANALSSSLNYHWDHLLTAELNSHGILNWTMAVEKEQHSTDKTFISSAVSFSNSSINMLYLPGLPFSKKTVSKDIKDLIWNRIDSEGMIQEQIVSVGPHIRPKTYTQVGTNQLLFQRIDGRSKSGFTLFTFKE